MDVFVQPGEVPHPSPVPPSHPPWPEAGFEIWAKDDFWCPSGTHGFQMELMLHAQSFHVMCWLGRPVTWRQGSAPASSVAPRVMMSALKTLPSRRTP